MTLIKEPPFDSKLPETELAIDAAIKAGKAIMRIYSQDFTTQFKSDSEPLTEADIESNKIINEIISVSNHPILSEEGIDDKKRLEHKKIWIIDPLDGTSDFINKTGEFTVMISLVEDKKPILGLIYWPTKNVLYLAQNEAGAFQYLNEKWHKITVSKVSELRKCRAVGSRFHLSEEEKNLLELLHIANFSSIGSSLKVAEISSGSAEIYFTTTNKIKQWDTCASYCLISEAGGKMTDMEGNDLLYNTEILNHENGLLVTNGLIHEKIVYQYSKLRN